MLSAQAAQSRRSISWQGQNRTRGQYGSEFQHEPPRQMQHAHGFFLSSVALAVKFDWALMTILSLNLSTKLVQIKVLINPPNRFQKSGVELLCIFRYLGRRGMDAPSAKN